MQIDLRTVSIKPLRQTYANIERRIGPNKPATRYQEATLDMQATANFHYRPTWQPQFELFDTGRTAVVMADWYAFKDPRQFYYGAYTQARARQQETIESNFDFVESKGLALALSDDLRAQALKVLLPLRHVAWGANMNNAYVCAYGYGTAITQPHIFAAMDQLGIAQYITRVGLLLDEPECLDAAKAAWLNDAAWQELRRYVEDLFVTKDWFEVMVAQDVVLNGLLYPLIYGDFVDQHLTSQGGSCVAMLTQFMGDWHAENAKWLDAQLKTVAAESPENAAQVSAWAASWLARAELALAPVAQLALGDAGSEALADAVAALKTRINKHGLSV